MLVAEEAVEIRVLRRQGKSIREIARMLDVSRNTVRRYLRSDGLSHYEREARPSKLDPFKHYIEERVTAAAPDWIPATVLLRELRALAYRGGYSILKDHLATLRPVAKPEPLIRFETEPGRQMQADFAAACGSDCSLSVANLNSGGNRGLKQAMAVPPTYGGVIDRVGRPGVNREIRDLIRQMSVANPLWGAPRIHGEMLKLGIEVSQATVGRHMVRRHGPPSPTWRTFLRNQVEGIAAIDMFVVVTAGFRLLYVSVILGHARRKILHLNVTQHPTAGWLSRQITEAFPWETAPRYLLRDRDASYG